MEGYLYTVEIFICPDIMERGQMMFSKNTFVTA